MINRPAWTAQTRPAFPEWAWTEDPDHSTAWAASDDDTGVSAVVYLGVAIEIHVHGGDCQVTICVLTEDEIGAAVVRAWRALHIAHGDEDPGGTS